MTTFSPHTRLSHSRLPLGPRARCVRARAWTVRATALRCAAAALRPSMFGWPLGPRTRYVTTLLSTQESSFDTTTTQGGAAVGQRGADELRLCARAPLAPTAVSPPTSGLCGADLSSPMGGGTPPSYGPALMRRRPGLLTACNPSTDPPTLPAAKPPSVAFLSVACPACRAPTHM